jgi:hypothetical protein
MPGEAAVGTAAVTLPAAADSLRAALDRAFADPAYRWVPPPRPLAWLEQRWTRFVDWFARIGAAHPTAQRLILAGAVVGLVAIFVHVTWVALRTFRYATASDRSFGVAAPAPRDAAWFLAAADRLAAEGRTTEAIVTAFQALALELAAGAAVRYHPSKTPREYVREARLPPPERDLLGSLVDQLYGFAFAGIPCGPDDYRAWRDRAGGGRWRAAAD